MKVSRLFLLDYIISSVASRKAVMRRGGILQNGFHHWEFEGLVVCVRACAFLRDRNTSHDSGKDTGNSGREGAYLCVA